MRAAAKTNVALSSCEYGVVSREGAGMPRAATVLNSKVSHVPAPCGRHARSSRASNMLSKCGCNVHIAAWATR